jgi:hypothetical protein
MPRAKSAPERQKQIGSWGGRRKGAGRKRELTLSDRRKIASDYHARMQKIRDLGNTPCREAAIRLMAEYGATHRMVERCLAEFLPYPIVPVRNEGGRRNDPTLAASGRS